MNEILITRYIAAWSWHLIAIMFFIGIVLLMVLSSYVFMIAFIVAFAVSEFMAWRRKREALELENES